ncbi:filensin [Ornithorhynchus anatinus]|uniref:Filensin n=1 Tax=Ornithorhynchus anatinus TaxID=9258 RepID=A0A6I8NPL3_ORNAN|nr:filensin [Ornithorhynchus anatinus]
MYRSSYLHETRKEKYERSDIFDEPQPPAELSGLTQAQGLENLQELNEQFANYINWARGLEQRNAIFRKQLETFRRLDDLAGLEEAFAEQIELNHQRVKELAHDRTKLEREGKDAQCSLDEFRNKYQNECDYQLLLKETLERLNKEADGALLQNLELQIESQFLQDDINATKDRYRKNLLEIQTYVSVLQQIIQTTPCVSTLSFGISEEKLIAERRIPILQSHLEEYKSILAQLQTQKSKLQAETTVLEQAIRNTHENYDDEIQLYNEQIETLRKGIEDAERTLEKCSSDCRQLASYQQSLENELERYRHIIENEDHRLNSAIVGTPVTLFMQSYRASSSPPPSGKDITRAIQDIATAKPRQKKVSRIKEITAKDKMDKTSGDKVFPHILEGLDGEQPGIQKESTSKPDLELEELGIPEQEANRQDIPDGAQISKACDKLCNMVRERVKSPEISEPQADLYNKGSYVLVTGDANYIDPSFCGSSIPAKGGIVVSIDGDQISNGKGVEAQPGVPEPTCSNGKGEPAGKEAAAKDRQVLEDKESGREIKDGKKTEEKTGDPSKGMGMTNQIPPPGPSGQAPVPHLKAGASKERDKKHTDKRSSQLEKNLPGSVTYEKVEVVESIETFSADQIQTYEETALIVETTIEKKGAASSSPDPGLQ